MKDVADVLRAWAGGQDRLPDLLADLEHAGRDSARWLDFMRRIRRAAGIKAPEAGPKPLLDLLETGQK